MGQEIKINFTDAFRALFLGDLRQEEATVAHLLSTPQEVQTYRDGDFTFHLLYSRLIGPEREQHFIIGTRQVGDVLAPEYCYEVLEDLFDFLEQPTPLVRLQALCQRFGAQLQVGQRLERVIVEELAPLDPTTAHDPRMWIRVAEKLEGKGFSHFIHRLIADAPQPTLNVKLAFCIKVNDYVRWLTRGTPYPLSPIRIDPALHGSMSLFDAAQSTATVSFEYYPGGKEAKLVEVTGDDYEFTLGVRASSFYISRNGYTAERDFSEEGTVDGRLKCIAVWAPNRIQVTVAGRSYLEEIARPDHDADAAILNRQQRVDTPTTFPPAELLHWIRKETLSSCIAYESREAFFDTVVNSLLSIQDKVDYVGDTGAFWDVEYAGRKVVRRAPKPEPKAHPICHALLRDIAVMKNLEISPEAQIGGGNLDFLVSGVLTNSALAHVCVEFKNAHSMDIVHGLESQLVSYMRTKGTKHGVYCVLWYKGEHWDKPTAEKTTFDLNSKLHEAKDRCGFPGIRIVIFDLSGKKAPSSR